MPINTKLLDSKEQDIFTRMKNDIGVRGLLPNVSTNKRLTKKLIARALI